MLKNQSTPHGQPLGFYGTLGQCKKMKELYSTIKKFASSATAPVLILGESGTGKELVARAIHDSGPLGSHPFVEINCTTLPNELLESELFGYERGAFTDAKQTKKRLLELADGGTFFLDEIGDMDLHLQVKLLRVLEKQSFRRIGGTKDIQVTMRILAATNRNLGKSIQEEKFREDLYYRLNVLSIDLPPLRERESDIALLADHFLDLFNRKYSKKLQGFSPEAKDLLENYPWPGNVRELKNSIERAVLITPAKVIAPQTLKLGVGHLVKKDLQIESKSSDEFNFTMPPEGISLIDLERAVIKKALKCANGNQSQAARLLKVSRELLRYRIKKHGLE